LPEIIICTFDLIGLSYSVLFFGLLLCIRWNALNHAVLNSTYIFSALEVFVLIVATHWY